MKTTRREFLNDVGKAGACATLYESLGMRGNRNLIFAAEASPKTDALKSGWSSPSRTFRPHTRWWWPGNAVTRDGIAWQLEQMHRQGMGGVEIMAPWIMYAEGNIPYLSPEYLEMVKYAIQEAARRDMEVAVTFGAGWRFGGFWVPPTQRSKVLTQGWMDVQGPGEFNQELPEYKPPAGVHSSLDPDFRSEAPDENKVLAVVAAQVTGDRLDGASLVDLTNKLEHGRLRWQIPTGQWRVMVFRLKYTGERNATTENLTPQHWSVDHFSKEAMRNYCEYLGGAFYDAFGPQFGKTVDSFFCDSFEIMVLPQTIHWSYAALEQFKACKGYDLAPYLPAIWWDIGELTPKIRYDVNDFLGWLGLDAMFITFIEWCAEHNAAARIQPYYRFTEELIQGAGVTPRPEMEVTTARFEVVADPRKSVAAGAHFYGREIVSAEAYTFIHMERYRTTLEEMKIATDAFLRDGVTQFYNHGYIYSPEMHVAPSRDMPWANRISHWNTWWKYYHCLTSYISRCCLLLRQGEFVADVLLYSPQATVWTEKVLFGDERRIMPFGDIAKTLVANGYDFDPVNDEVLQNRARAEAGSIKVRNLVYRFLILPNARALPVATLEFVRKFVQAGGIVIALDELASASVGLHDHVAGDDAVKKLVAELFGSDGQGRLHPGGGRTYHLGDYKIPGYEITQRNFGPGPRPYEPTPTLTAPQQALLSILREHLAPDFAMPEVSNGLTFLHRRLGENDLYFVTNLQPAAIKTTVKFRVPGKVPEQWNPYTGDIDPVFVYQPDEKGVSIPLDLPPWASTLLMFRPGARPLYATQTNLEQVLELSPGQVRGLAAGNGQARVNLVANGTARTASVAVSDVPPPLAVGGEWKMRLEGHGFETYQSPVRGLASWTENPRTAHFSGTGAYEADFDLPPSYVDENLLLTLELGTVGNVAEVILNGHNAGVAWMQPYRLDVTQAMRAGQNHLQVLVTNTLINYVAGMSQLPPVPEELAPHYGLTADLYHEGTTEWERHEKNFQPLPASGLIGPVTIIPYRRVSLKL